MIKPNLKFRKLSKLNCQKNTLEIEDKSKKIEIAHMDGHSRKEISLKRYMRNEISYIQERIDEKIDKLEEDFEEKLNNKFCFMEKKMDGYSKRLRDLEIKKVI